MLNGTVQFPKVSVTPGAKTVLQAISWHLKYMETNSEFFCLETSYLHFEPHPYKFDFENIALAPFLTYTKGGDRDC